MQFVIHYGVDLLLAVLLLTCVITSMRNGFLRCLLSLVCAVAAIFVATSFSEPAAEWCYDNIVSEIVVSNVEKSIDEKIDTETVALAVNDVIESVPEFVAVRLAELGVDVNAFSKEISQQNIQTSDIAEKISDEIIRPGALVLLRLILYLIIFIAVRFLLSMVSNVICKVADLPLLKQVNKLLGAVIGVVKGIALVFALSLFLEFFSYLLKNTNVFAQAIENSRICDIIIELIK